MNPTTEAAAACQALAALCSTPDVPPDVLAERAEAAARAVARLQLDLARRLDPDRR